MESNQSTTGVQPEPPEWEPLPGAVRDGQSVTREWQSLQPLIDGVVVKEVRNVTKDNGMLTEIWRKDWDLDGLPVGQVFQNVLLARTISAWHVHRWTTDRIFVNHGLLKLVVYDGRPESATHGMFNEFRIGSVRPALVVVPPGVWHRVENLESTPGALLNLVDRAYDYEHPDHWRLASDTDRIPYRAWRARGPTLPPSDAV